MFVRLVFLEHVMLPAHAIGIIVNRNLQINDPLNHNYKSLIQAGDHFVTRVIWMAGVLNFLKL